jgi:hypothetical protein
LGVGEDLVGHILEITTSDVDGVVDELKYLIGG